MDEKKTMQYYTLEEIAKNNGKDTDRVWIIYKDSVYDCTDYLDDVSSTIFFSILSDYSLYINL